MAWKHSKGHDILKKIIYSPELLSPNLLAKHTLGIHYVNINLGFLSIFTSLYLN